MNALLRDFIQPFFIFLVILILIFWSIGTLRCLYEANTLMLSDGSVLTEFIGKSNV